MTSTDAATGGTRLFGWRIVLGCFLAQMFAMGLSVGAYPVFMASIEAEFGASRAQTSLGIPLVMLTGALVAPLLGRVVDKGSTRAVMTLGALVLGAGLGALSAAHSLWFLTLAWVALVGLGQAMLGVIPANTVLANWFDRRRASMVALAGTGITVGAAAAPPIAEWLIQGWDWRLALQVFAMACLLVPAPVVFLLIVKSPRLLGLHPDGVPFNPATAAQPADDGLAIPFFRDPRFWLAGGALACMPAVLMGFNTHVVAWSETLGFGREFGVGLLSFGAVVTAASSLVCGRICDRLGPYDTLRLALLVEIGGWTLLLTAAGTAVFTLGVALFAFGAGSFMPCQASLVSRLWPVGVFGRASALVGLIVILAIVVIPTGIGLGFELTGSYRVSMTVITGVLCLPIVLLTLLRRCESAAFCSGERLQLRR
jgi:MFS family permease